MKERLLGAIIISIICIPCFIFGGIAFAIMANLIGMLALFELINVNKDLKKIPTVYKLLSFISVPLIAFTNIKDAYYFGIDYVAFVIPILLLLLPCIFVNNNKYSTNKAFILLFISFLSGIVTHLFISIFNLNKWLFLFLVIIAVATDVFAYLGGRFFGKHKFSKISPNKTIEGCVTGTIAGTAISYIYYMNMFVINNGVVLLGVILLLCVAGIVGDIFFSLIKRENDTKDYSNFIPGHGGICDRLDSLTFIMLVYILISRFL